MTPQDITLLKMIDNNVQRVTFVRHLTALGLAASVDYLKEHGLYLNGARNVVTRGLAPVFPVNAVELTQAELEELAEEDAT